MYSTAGVFPISNTCFMHEKWTIHKLLRNILNDSFIFSHTGRFCKTIKDISEIWWTTGQQGESNYNVIFKVNNLICLGMNIVPLGAGCVLVKYFLNR